MKSNPNQRLLIGLGAAAAFGLTSTWWLHQPPPNATPLTARQAQSQAAGVEISTGALMAISLPGADGKSHALAEFQGKPLVINFWATWCDPCRAELPLLTAFANRAEVRGKASVVGIALDTPAAVQGFLSTQPLGFPVLIEENDVGEKLAGRLGDTSGSLPFTAILDRRGVVVETRLGPWKAGELEARLAPLMAP